MIYSAVRRQTTAGGRGTHEIRQPWVLPAAEISSAFTKKSSQIAPHPPAVSDFTLLALSLLIC